MKTFFFFLISIFSFSQVAEPTKVVYNDVEYWKYDSVDEANNTPYTFYFMYDIKGQYLGWKYEFPKDGFWISFYKEDSTKVASIFEVNRGLKNGISTQFFLNGKKASEFLFRDNEEIGFVRYWNELGILESECFHNDNHKLEGECKKWNEEGILIESYNYKNGLLNGKQSDFHENGNIKSEEFYLNGKENGIFRFYYPNGQLYKKMIFENGVCVDENVSFEYNTNGTIRAKGSLKNEKKHGYWKYYYENGNIQGEGNYGIFLLPHSHGYELHIVKVGKWKYYYPNGILKSKGSYFSEKETNKLNSDKGSMLDYSVKKNNWIYFDEKGNKIDFLQTENNEDDNYDSIIVHEFRFFRLF